MRSLPGFRGRVSIRFAALVVASLGQFSMPLGAAADSDDQAQAAGGKYLTLLGVPSATVAPQGMTFGSIYSASGFSGGRQHALSFGQGFGDANRGFGFQVSATAGLPSGPYDEYGYFGLKASRRVIAGQSPTYLGISADRLGGWGESDSYDPAFSLVVTRFSQLRGGANGGGFPVMYSVGAGNAVSDMGSSGGGFIGMGIGLTETLAASAAWNGDNVTLGTSFRPRALKNASFSVMLEDAFDQDDRQRFSLAISFFGRDIFRR